MSDRNEIRRRPDRRSLITVATMIGGILLVALVGPTVADTFSNQLAQPEVTSLADPLEPMSTQSRIAGSTLDPVADETTRQEQPVATPTSTIAPPPESTTTTPGVVAGESDPADALDEAPRPLQSIQLVPALRDVIVDIGGVEYASDGDGLISIGTTEPGAVFEFVGIRSIPSLRSVAFGRWADGNPDSRRRLDEIDGPDTAIGLVLSHRVTVSTLQSSPDDARLVFASDAGVVRLPIGRTAWVPASRGIEVGGALVEQQLTYQLTGLDDDGVVTEVDLQEFEATPEALWVADVPA